MRSKRFVSRLDFRDLGLELLANPASSLQKRLKKAETIESFTSFERARATRDTNAAMACPSMTFEAAPFSAGILLFCPVLKICRMCRLIPWSCGGCECD
jgi:hypothetical protein